MTAVVLAFALASSQGQAGGQPPTAYGHGGSMSCGQWTNAGESRRLEDRIDRSAAESWVLGFLSGVEFARSILPSSSQQANEWLRMATTDYDAAMKWVDTFCKANPLDSLERAAWGLAVELRRRRGAVSPASLRRSSTPRRTFMRASGYATGRPGYVVDHIVPLACGGADHPDNMQWQTVEDAKAKDRIERKGC